MSSHRTKANPCAASNPVVTWRLRRLVAAGFAPGLAADLAANCDIDLHAVLELVDRGCPPQLAVRIVAPLNDRAWPC